MRKFVGVSEAAMLIEESTGCAVIPRHISDLIYKRKLDVIRCPIVRRFREIPVSYLPTVEAALREDGRLPAAEEQAT